MVKSTPCFSDCSVRVLKVCILIVSDHLRHVYDDKTSAVAHNNISRNCTQRICLSCTWCLEAFLSRCTFFPYFIHFIHSPGNITRFWKSIFYVRVFFDRARTNESDYFSKAGNELLSRRCKSFLFRNCSKLWFSLWQVLWWLLYLRLRVQIYSQGGPAYPMVQCLEKWLHSASQI